MFNRPAIQFLLSLCVFATLASSGWAAEQKADECILENPSLRYSITLRNGAVEGRTFVNRLSGKTVSLPKEEFLLEFKDGGTVGSSDCTATFSSKKEQNAELLFTPKGEGRPAIEVRVQYTLPPGKSYLRKQISVRQKGGDGLRLMRADLESWKDCAGLWDSMRADVKPYGSHPIFCEDIWAGVEFVAAFNEYDRSGFVLRSRPGGARLGAEWLPLHSTVVGAAPRDKVKNAFLSYIEDIRLSPPRMTWCYNTWWTLKPPIKEADLVRLAEELKQRLYDKHGVFFDVFATDEGWAEKESIWEMNRKVLPHAFDRVREVIEPAGGHMGLWISPSASYPNSTDYDWAVEHGFAFLGGKTKAGKRRGALSLGDPKYSEKAKDALTRLIRENKLAHVKFDGFVAREDAAHDDLLPGLDSIEPLATRALELLTAAKKANPELVTEPTCFNSWMSYNSPWQIKYSDTVYGNAGADHPRGIGPAPDYREATTNSREWYIFSALNEVWLPQNALQYFDIVHFDAADGFINHAAMAVGRGRFFMPVYVNPKFISDEEWGAMAGLMRWARKNQDVLRQTVVLPSRVELGEPYAYAHWLGKRGIVAVRNPSNESRTYGLDLRAAGAPADLADGVCYTQFPYREGLMAGVDGKTIIPIRLAPWELLFVEIAPRSELREPVAIGARWYRDDAGKMQIAPDGGVKQVEVLQPGAAAKRYDVAITPVAAPGGKFLSRTVELLPKDQWMKPGDTSLPTTGFDFDCDVSIPEGATGKVLLLLEYPNRQHAPHQCVVTVNDGEVKLQGRSSVSRAGYPHGAHMFNPKSFWAGILPYQSEWTWYICPVEAGNSRVHLKGSVAQPDARIGLWIWSERDRAPGLQSLTVPCSKPEMPQVRERIERQGVCILRPGG